MLQIRIEFNGHVKICQYAKNLLIWRYYGHPYFSRRGKNRYFKVKFLKKIKEYTHTKPKTKKLIGIVGFIGVLLPVIPELWLMFFGLELLSM